MHHLDRHVTALALCDEFLNVAGPIDDAHPALADELHDPVGTDLVHLPRVGAAEGAGATGGQERLTLGLVLMVGDQAIGLEHFQFSELVPEDRHALELPPIK